MDYFFLDYSSQCQEDIWFDEALLQVKQSAFVKYSDHQPNVQNFRAHCFEDGFKRRNLNKRMIEFLRQSWKPKEELLEIEREKGHRHMISERLRRERQKQSYLALHELLPPGTKGDKNSIVQMAATTIQKLERCKEEMKRKNDELQMASLAAQKDIEMEKSVIRFSMHQPPSGIDALLEIFKCLKKTGSRATMIQSSFAAEEFSAVLEIETKAGAAEVEKTVQQTLFQIEGNFFPISGFRKV